jgi:hypothetical protein
MARGAGTDIGRVLSRVAQVSVWLRATRGAPGLSLAALAVCVPAGRSVSSSFLPSLRSSETPIAGPSRPSSSPPTFRNAGTKSSRARSGRSCGCSMHHPRAKPSTSTR